MLFKDRVEQNPIFLLFSVGVASFLGGVGVITFLEAREESLRQQILEELRIENVRLSDDRNELEDMVLKVFVQYIRDIERLEDPGAIEQQLEFAIAWSEVSTSLALKADQTLTEKSPVEEVGSPSSVLIESTLFSEDGSLPIVSENLETSNEQPFLLSELNKENFDGRLRRTDSITLAPVNDEIPLPPRLNTAIADGPPIVVMEELQPVGKEDAELVQSEERSTLALNVRKKIDNDELELEDIVAYGQVFWGVSLSKFDSKNLMSFEFSCWRSGFPIIVNLSNPDVVFGPIPPFIL